MNLKANSSYFIWKHIIRSNNINQPVRVPVFKNVELFKEIRTHQILSDTWLFKCRRNFFFACPTRTQKSVTYRIHCLNNRFMQPHVDGILYRLRKVIHLRTPCTKILLFFTNLIQLVYFVYYINGKSHVIYARIISYSLDIKSLQLYLNDIKYRERKPGLNWHLQKLLFSLW